MLRIIGGKASLVDDKRSQSYELSDLTLSTGRIDGAAERRMTEHARARRERVRERARERVSGGGKRRSKERNGSAARRARRARRERGSGWREGKWRCGA